MKKGTRGIIERVLSSVALIGLLSLFVGQAFGSTEVYNVPARFMTHTAGQYSSLTQYFRMTCDSVLSVNFFNGWYPGQGTFWAELRDSATGALAWNGSRNTADSLKYKDVGFTVNTSVTRGKTYKLIIGYTYGFGGTDYHLDVYYDSTNAYPYGYMYPYYGNVDLCARVGGVNRIAPDFWGANWEITNWMAPTLKEIYAAKAESIGAKWNREMFRWDQIQDTVNSFRFKSWSDSAVRLTWAANAQHSDSIIGVLYGTPWWASSGPPDSNRHCDTCWAGRWPLPYMSYAPLSLDSPVVHGDVINPNNYWGYFVFQVVNRYKDTVKVWEIWNEENARNYWRVRDSTGTHNVYDDFKRLWIVADSAAKKADPSGTTRLVLGGLSNVIDLQTGNTGYDWLKKMYERDVADSSKIISFHLYQDNHSDTMARHFDRSVDSLRSLMRANGDAAKPAWLTEVGWTTESTNSDWRVDQAGQANRAVYAYGLSLARLGNANGPIEKVQWFDLKDCDTTAGSGAAYGLIRSHPTSPTNKKSWYAFKQMSTKFKDKYFNRRVPLADTNVFAYEFQVPGADTLHKTWCLWLNNSKHEETLAVRTNVTWLVTRDTIPSTDSVLIDTNPTRPYGRITEDGKIIIYENRMDTVPRYLHEVGAVSRPDVIVDSVWLVKASGTGEPRAGDGVRFYARIKNISTTDSLKSTIVNKVTFQVDGVTKATYQAQRGLTKQGDPLHLDTLTVGYIGVGPAPDWYTTWGDHLIRAWADSADRYVELREDNNCGYLWKHFQPKVSVVINHDSKFAKTRNDTLHIILNGNTYPLPDSAKLKHEGSWTRINSSNGERDTVVTYNSDGAKYDSVKVFQGGDTYTGGDSIIVDTNAPYTDISSPIQNQWVSGTVPFKGNANDWYEHHLSYWEIRKDPTGPWCSGTNEVGTLNPVIIPGTFGNWNSTQWPNGYYWHWLMVNDSAGNTGRDSVRVYVNNAGGGDGLATGFGSTPSSPMNVATDPSGNVYIAETQNSKVRKYSPRKDSLFAFSVKRGNDTTGTSWATAIVLKDSLTIWIADGYAHAIKRFDRQGNLLLRFGSFGSDTSRFKQPCGIALDNKGRLWVSDRLNNRIQVFDSTGHFLFQFGSQGQDSGKFNSPTGITITPNGLVWVSDTRNNQIQVFDSLGQYLKTIKAVDSLGLDTPLGICSDKWGDVFVADSRHNRIVELNPYGDRILDFGGLGDSLCQFRTPVGVASSPGAHYLYVADMGNRRVQRFWVIQDDTLGGGGPQSNGQVRLPPRVYFLAQSHPNPTTGEAMIEYGLPEASQVNLTIYNVAGQVVREYNPGKQKAWYYSIQWDGRSNRGHKVGAGVYFYRLEAGCWVKTRKMVVIR